MSSGSVYLNIQIFIMDRFLFIFRMIFLPRLHLFDIHPLISLTDSDTHTQSVSSLPWCNTIIDRIATFNLTRPPSDGWNTSKPACYSLSHYPWADTKQTVHSLSLRATTYKRTYFYQIINATLRLTDSSLLLTIPYLSLAPSGAITITIIGSFVIFNCCR